MVYFEAPDFFFSSRIRYFCNQGYQMISKHNYRDCKADGTWSHGVPECEVIICGPPDEIDKGHFTPVKEEYSYLDSVKYKCDDDLVLDGEHSVYCTENGSWSVDAPNCIAVICKPPDDLVNGKYSPLKNQYYFSEKVTYKCKDNLKLDGASTLFCTENGKWSSSPPTCRVVTCEPPRSISEGIYSPLKARYHYRDEVTYKCKDNLNLVGRSTLVCEETGMWSSGPPKCKAVTCGPPGDLNKGEYSPIKREYTYMDQVIYKCKDNLELEGASTVSCKENGKWNSEPPKCTVVTCKPPVSMQNREYSPHKTQYTYMDQVTYKCKNNLKLVGEITLFCVEKEKWSSEPPECIGEIKCPLPEIRNGTILIHSSNSVRIDCHSGYVRNGSSIMTCQSNGKWSSLTTCVPRVSCLNPKIFNGEIKQGTASCFQNGLESGYKVMDQVKVACNTGYSLKGDNTIICGYDLQWYPRIPICQGWLDCTYPAIENGRIVLKNGKEYVPEDVGHGFDWGDTVQLQCDSGYVMQGDANSYCAFRWKWSPELPKCVLSSVNKLREQYAV
ncbi:C4b-binding protein isoform X2 [Bombina bombina]|uniref:C4b-binding protein isoform X2 n=1 Tax=Bombina bombina TaxID=8345 RepID=UPI00235B1FEF|nr:C4b-binding protein isoform X2 [Bombina bombina]